MCGRRGKKRRQNKDNGTRKHRLSSRGLLSEWNQMEPSNETRFKSERFVWSGNMTIGERERERVFFPFILFQLFIYSKIRHDTRGGNLGTNRLLDLNCDTRLKSDQVLE